MTTEDFIPMLLNTETCGGLYLHIPFCRTRCGYCDFYTQTDLSLKASFLAALEREIRERKDRTLDFDTVYIGGGTPSMLTVREVSHLIDTVGSAFHLKDGAEITLEVNPGSLNLEKLKGYRKAGVNRLNIGIQSFQNRNLRFLGRTHSAAEGLAALENAHRAAFDNIGIDLIFGLPGQTVTAWEQDLRQAVSLEPEHLACYMLTYEADTPLYRKKEEGLFKPLAEDLVALQFQRTREFLVHNGYQHYEISNFAASKQKRSRHNMKYWHFVPYLGLGPSAHSYVYPRRWWNVSDTTRYITDLIDGKSVVGDMEVLSREQSIIEVIFIGLRCADGIDMAWFERTFDVDFQKRFATPIKRLLKKDLIRMHSERMQLTPEGMLFLDSVAELLISRGSTD